MVHPANSLDVIPIRARRMEFASFKMDHSNASVLQDIRGSYVSCPVLHVSLMLIPKHSNSLGSGGTSWFGIPHYLPPKLLTFQMEIPHKSLCCCIDLLGMGFSF